MSGDWTSERGEDGETYYHVPLDAFQSIFLKEGNMHYGDNPNEVCMTHGPRLVVLGTMEIQIPERESLWFTLDDEGIIDSYELRRY